MVVKLHILYVVVEGDRERLCGEGTGTATRGILQLCSTGFFLGICLREYLTLWKRVEECGVEFGVELRMSCAALGSPMRRRLERGIEQGDYMLQRAHGVNVMKEV